jgi:hypothetical protein
MGYVAITGIDLGAAGLRIDAYDAAIGGTLVAFDTAFGIGLGIGNFAQVSTTSASIFRVEMYQVTPGLGGDGLALDNFIFSPSGVPDTASTFPLLLAALAGLMVTRRSRR